MCIVSCLSIIPLRSCVRRGHRRSLRLAFEAYVADVEVDGDQDLSGLTDGPDLGYRTYIHVDYDQVREVCSIATSRFPGLL